MSESEPTQDRKVAVATLEINREGPSPRGALTSADGRRASFAGWSEFAAVIEDWRAWTSASASHRERPGQEWESRFDWGLWSERHADAW